MSSSPSQTVERENRILKKAKGFCGIHGMLCSITAFECTVTELFYLKLQMMTVIQYLQRCTSKICPHRWLEEHHILRIYRLLELELWFSNLKTSPMETKQLSASAKFAVISGHHQKFISAREFCLQQRKLFFCGMMQTSINLISLHNLLSSFIYYRPHVWKRSKCRIWKESGRRTRGNCLRPTFMAPNRPTDISPVPSQPSVNLKTNLCII